ncbi:nitroreductase family protein [Elusimicrobiota bacterium]
MDYKEFLHVLKTRRSIRKFLSDEVPRQDIERIIEAASLAPSGTNLQNWHFIVIRSKQVKQDMMDAIDKKLHEEMQMISSPTAKKSYKAYSQYYKFFGQAPVTVAVIRKPYKPLNLRIMSRYNINKKDASRSGVQSVAAAIQNLILMAHVLGYGTCWMTGPLIAKTYIEEILNVEKNSHLLALIPIGKYTKIPSPTPRKKIEEIVEYM